MTRPVSYLTLIVLFLNFTVLSGQTKTEIKEMFYEAEAFALYEEWQEALPGFLQLLEMFPENYNYKYRIGMCYLNIPGQKEKSLSYLQEAVNNINPKYKEGRFKETGAPYDALYHLAVAYQVTNQLDKAIETFNRFYNGMDPRLYDTTIVKFQIETCYNAKRLMNLPLYLKEVNQGDMINESFSEFNPVVSADESVMVFSKKLQFYTAPFFTRKVNGEWSPPIQLIEQLLIDEGISTSLSADGTELYLYKSDNYDGNIYFSRYVDGRWTPAVKLNENINTNYWESHATVSSDGKTLFFTSNRKGSIGGLDIYYSKKDSLGDWGPAVNMGPVINTPFNEDTPFLDKSNKTLFFSSRGHYNMGGHDIFYSTLLDDGTWSIPVNMGYPVNTTDDDLFFSPVGDGYIAYQSKFDDHGYGQQDIFRLEVFSDNHRGNLWSGGWLPSGTC
ncbi:MAG: tetratricopeptide repeat protein [Bacteroidales bacterium]